MVCFQNPMKLFIHQKIVIRLHIYHTVNAKYVYHNYDVHIYISGEQKIAKLTQSLG